MRTSVFIAIACLLTSTTAATAQQADILPNIILKKQAAVEKILGKSDAKCEASEIGTLCKYRKGAFEVTYIKGVADWITWLNPDGVEFYPGAMRSLGVKCSMNMTDWAISKDKFAWYGTCLGYPSVELLAGSENSVADSPNRPLKSIIIHAKTPGKGDMDDLGVMNADGTISKE